MKLLAIFNLDGEADTLAKTWLTDNNVIWKLFVHLQQNKILFLDEPAAGMNHKKRLN